MQTLFSPPARTNDTQSPSLLCLKGQQGTIACRVHDPLLTRIIPQRSRWGRLRYALLSEEKMGNLTAVRGTPGARMLGPGDYFCDLERSDQYLISIDINREGIPAFAQYPLTHPDHSKTTALKALDESVITTVNARWFSGFQKEELRQKLLEYKSKKNPLFSDSLFPNPGLLEIEEGPEITLQRFDPTGIDFSEFKARLVRNDTPFQITKERLYVDDEYCAVSYHYDPGYADRQIKEGGGLFLEHHQFAQTITPLHRDSKGFVTLGKWNDSRDRLELIAIEIPYGYTLIIEKNCIHGDATLTGQFMMCMTSDHISMATADTVFLKQAATRDNLALTLDAPVQTRTHRAYRTMDPLVCYRENRKQSAALFHQRRQGLNVVFNPFSPGYLDVQQDAIMTAVCFILAGACFVAAITLSPEYATPFSETGLLSIAILVAGMGLSRVFDAFDDENVPMDNVLMM